MKAFLTSQFNYCPLVCMFHSRKLNNKINRLHERCLRLICSDRISSYEELLDKHNSVPIHQKNLQKLAIEMFKTYTGMTTQIMNEVFPRNHAFNYSLRRHREFVQGQLIQFIMVQNHYVFWDVKYGKCCLLIWDVKYGNCCLLIWDVKYGKCCLLIWDVKYGKCCLLIGKTLIS